MARSRPNNQFDTRDPPRQRASPASVTGVADGVCVADTRPVAAIQPEKRGARSRRQLRARPCCAAKLFLPAVRVGVAVVRDRAARAGRGTARQDGAGGRRR